MAIRPPQRPIVRRNIVKTKNNGKEQHPHYIWVALCTKIGEEDISEAAFVKKIVDFLHKVLPGRRSKKRISNRFI
jgi:hypothetical protein